MSRRPREATRGETYNPCLPARHNAVSRSVGTIECVISFGSPRRKRKALNVPLLARGDRASRLTHFLRERGLQDGRLHGPVRLLCHCSRPRRCLHLVRNSNVEDFLDRCFVMFFTRYTRGRPKPPAWTPSIPLFVCEHRYKDDVKAFKKIKSWASCIPEEIRVHEYDFEPFEDGRVEQLTRVKSPFVRGMAGPGRLSGAAASAPAYHFSQDGKPQTAEEAKATVPEARAHPASSLAPTVAQPTAGFDTPAPVPQPTFPSLAAQAPVIPSLSSLPPSSSDFAVEPVGAPSPASTPAEQAASLEDFAPLPASLSASPSRCLSTSICPDRRPSHAESKFRSDALGDVLWFSAPAAVVAPIARPAHSLEYLYWRAQQRQQLA